MDARPFTSIRRRHSDQPLPSPVRRANLHIVAHLPHPAADAAFCWRDANGCEQFSFPQLVWLYPDVAMRVTPRYCRAGQVLAVNILSLVLVERDYPAWIGVTSQRAVRLAKPFFEECLCELPQDGWRIPFETLDDWLSSCAPEDLRP